MDPETEARFAAMLMEEAERLRRRAEKEGVAGYLAKPVLRVRPNPQFMRATVRGVQQANRVVEIKEMWRRRSVELDENYTKKVREARLAAEAAKKLHSRREDAGASRQNHDSNARAPVSKVGSQSRATDRMRDGGGEQSGDSDGGDDQDVEWRDDDIEKFLNSRIKRGRGAVGCRMDEPGPYPAPQMASRSLTDVRVKEDWEDRVIGPTAGASSRTGTSTVEAGGLWVKKKHKSKRRDGAEEFQDSEKFRHKRKEKSRKKRRAASSTDEDMKTRKRRRALSSG